MKEAEIHNDLTVNYNSFPHTNPEKGVIRPEFRNSHAIIWFKQGQGKYSVDFKKYRLRAGTIIFISKDQDTSFEFSGDANDYVIITFPQHYIGTDPEIQKLVSFCIREHFEGKQILKTGADDNQYLEMLVRQLFTIHHEWTNAYREASAFHFLQLFLIYCNKLKSEQNRTDSGAYSAVVGNFTALLEKSFRYTHKVNYYTDNLNLTYNSLSRYTTNYCSKTPKEIIAERIVLEIKRLLSGTSLPVKEIAFRLGFDEPTNLVKYFKKHTGTTPTAFRGQH
jgi:AraC family transcriptional regulator, transcriptional activator of pobA